MDNLDISGASLLEFGSVNSTIAIQYKWKLKEKINSEILQKALDNTLEQFPYFRKTLINNNGIATYVENPYPVYIRKSDQYENVGSFINNYHLIQVTYDENIINVYISHNLTDGFGMKLFNEALITNYVNLEYDCDFPLPKNYQEGIDPFLQHFEVSEDYEFKDFTEDSHFVSPEESTKDTYNYLEFDYSKLKEVCNNLNVSPTAFLALITLITIQASYPDNSNVITTRAPIDSREILNIETLKNASNPQVIFSLNPKEYDKDNTTNVLKRFNEDIKDQIDNDRIAFINNNINNLISGKEAILETFKVFDEPITVSYFGNMLPNGATEYVDWLYIVTKLDPTLKLYVFMYRLGNKGFIGMMKYIESNKLWDNLKKQISEFGL